MALREPDRSFLPSPVRRTSELGGGRPSRHAAARRVHVGEWHHPLHGIWWADPRAPSHEELANVVIAHYPPRTVLSDRSAADCWGWDLPGTDVHVTIPDDLPRRSAPRGVVVHHRRLPDDDVTSTGGLLVTTPVRTLLDLVASLPETDAVWFVDQRLKDAPAVVAEARARARGRVRDRIGKADGRSESWLETHARLLLLRAGLPLFTPQYVLRTAGGLFVARFDGAYEDIKHAQEFDSKEHHSDPAALYRDRRRQNEVTTSEGWTLSRYTWADLVHDAPRYLRETAAVLMASGVRWPRRGRRRWP